jgi:hypothetical protein
MTDWNWSRNLLQAIPSAVYGAIVGVSAPVAQPEAKRALHVSTGALAVDMESHVVASVAAARGLPMTAVRVITDSAMRELPRAALAAMRANGTIDIAALIRSMMKEPSELPMLLRTALDAVIGVAALLRCRPPACHQSSNTSARRPVQRSTPADYSPPRPKACRLQVTFAARTRIRRMVGVTGGFFPPQ